MHTKRRKIFMGKEYKHLEAAKFILPIIVAVMISIGVYFITTWLSISPEIRYVLSFYIGWETQKLFENTFAKQTSSKDKLPTNEKRDANGKNN